MSKKETTRNIFGNPKQSSGSINALVRALQSMLRDVFSRQERSVTATAKAIGKALSAFDELNILKMPAAQKQTTTQNQSAADSEQTATIDPNLVSLGAGAVLNAVSKVTAFTNLLTVLSRFPAALVNLITPGRQATSIFTKVSNAFKQAKTSGNSVRTAALNLLPAALTKLITPGRQSVSIFSKISGAFQQAKTSGEGVRQKTSSVAQIVGKMGKAWQNANSFLSQWQKTSKGLQKAEKYQGITSLSQVVQTLAASFKSCKQNAEGTLSSIKQKWGGLKTWFSTNVTKPITDYINGLFGGSLFGKSTAGAPSSTATPTEIPKLATGAVLPANKPFLALLGDQKNGTNVEAPLDTIKQAVAEVVGNRDVVIQFTGDLAQLARVLRPAIARENLRVGGSMITREVM